MTKKTIFLDCINSHENQLTISQIQKQTGLSRSTINRYCEEFNYDVMKQTEPWNKGLSKESNTSLLSISQKLTGIKKQQRTNEEKQKISSTMKDNPNSGGFRESGGRGEKHLHKGIILNSDSAFGVAKMLDKENIKWEKPLNEFSYTDSAGLSKNAILDFYLPHFDLYISVKTNATSTVKNKLMNIKKNHTINLLIVDELMYKRFMYNSVNDILGNFLK